MEENRDVIHATVGVDLARSRAAAMDDRSRAIGTVLGHVVALGRSIVAEQRAPFEGMGLTPNQGSLLFLLARTPDGLMPGTAALKLGITRGAVTQLVEPLRTAGLVESAPHPQDGRSRLLRLTASARDRVATYEEGVVARLAPKFDPLDDRDIAALADLLDRIEETA